MAIVEGGHDTVEYPFVYVRGCVFFFHAAQIRGSFFAVMGERCVCVEGEGRGLSCTYMYVQQITCLPLGVHYDCGFFGDASGAF